ncbi:hypothetical protein GCM10010433_55450 [Streptomyces pulveraceus]
MDMCAGTPYGSGQAVGPGTNTPILGTGAAGTARVRDGAGTARSATTRGRSATTRGRSWRTGLGDQYGRGLTGRAAGRV